MSTYLIAEAGACHDGDLDKARDRFLDKVQPEPNSGCWLWTGHRMRNGYGQAWVDGHVTSAHRAAYLLFVGSLPPGRERVVDHLCRNPACVNPAHLDPVSNHENLLRGIPGQWVARTHCSRGHAYSPENTYRNPGGRGRTCRACRDAYMAVYNPSYYRRRR